MSKTPAEEHISKPDCFASRITGNGMVLGFVGVLLACVAVYSFTLPQITICKKTTNTATANNIESAVNNFHTEYGTMPDVKNHVTTDSAEGIKLLTILRGMENPSTPMQNSRSINFLCVKEARNKRDGMIYNKHGNSIEGLFDSWGNPYVIELDTKNAGSLHFTHGNRTIELKDRRVAVYSPGKDGKLGTRDDFTTW
jgi:hypothetical protein